MCLECLCLCQQLTSKHPGPLKENQSLRSAARIQCITMYSIIVDGTNMYIGHTSAAEIFPSYIWAMILAGLTFAPLPVAGLKACRILLFDVIWVSKPRITSLKLCYNNFYGIMMDFQLNPTLCVYRSKEIDEFPAEHEITTESRPLCNSQKTRQQI